MIYIDSILDSTLYALRTVRRGAPLLPSYEAQSAQHSASVPSDDNEPSHDNRHRITSGSV